MAEELTELVVSLRADVAGLRSSLESAKEATREFTESVGGQFEKLGEMLLEIFAVEKISEWTKKGIEEFAELDYQLNLIVQNLKLYGIATEDSKDQILAWSEAIAHSTMFSKTEALGAFEKLLTATHNITAAQKLSILAMDISTKTHQDSVSVARALGQAYQGNFERLRQLKMEFPELNSVIDSHRDVLKYLHDQTQELSKTMGAEEGGLAFAINQAKKSLIDMFEESAKKMKIEIPLWLKTFDLLAFGISKVVSIVIKAITSVPMFVATIIGTIIATFQTAFRYADLLATAFDDLIHFRFKSYYQNLKMYGNFQILDAKTNVAYWKKQWSDLWTFTSAESKSHAVSIASDLEGVTSKAGNENKKKHKELHTYAHMYIEQTGTEWEQYFERLKRDSGLWVYKFISDAREMFQRLGEEQNEALEGMKKAEADYNDAADKRDTKKMTEAKKRYDDYQRHFKEGADARKKLEEEIDARAKQVAQNVAAVSQSAVSQMVKAYQDGTLSIGKAFEILGKSIFKSIVSALGEGLIQEGASYIAKGTAALLSLVDAPMAPGLFAAGASLAAAGGGIKGIAETALAEGGIVTRPTVALIGEAGPEKVIPLNRADASGGIHFNGPINLPNVRDPRGFIAEMQRMKSRAGYRYTSF